MLSLRRFRGVGHLRRFMSKVVGNTKEESSASHSFSPRGALDEPEIPPEEKLGSFVQDLFLGKFDTGALIFPEISEKDRHDWLNSTIAPIKKFFEEKVDSRAIDSQAKIPEDILTGLKVLGLFGQQIPEHLGGLGLNTTEHARISEVVGLDSSIGLTLAYHQSFVVKALLSFGSESQKAKYFPTLASGQQIGAFCLSEPSSGSDLSAMQTSATLSTDGKRWLLSGSKSMITNGDFADIFLVFAKTADSTVDATSPKRITAFIVERKFGGVTNGEKLDKLGVRGSTTCNVSFDNTPVAMDHVVGQVGDGFEIATSILSTARLTTASLGLGLMKKMISLSANHAINREQFGKPISEYQLVREKLGRMTLSAYVIESLIYFTAGIIDLRSYSDTSVETAIVKVVSSEGCWQCANECLQILGGQGYMKDSAAELMLRDSRLFSIAEQTNEMLRLYIATSGIQHSGQALRDLVKQIRNPLQFPGLAIRKSIERMRQQSSTLKLTLRLQEYLHPTLAKSADLLEFSVQRLKYIAELLLERYGADVVNTQMQLKRIADMTIDLYAMTAVLSRASRSYCIGLRNADIEVSLADVFCAEAAERIKIRATEVERGEYPLPDTPLMIIADSVLKTKGYFPEHPLSRTFW